jgi:hypothetical protein
MGLKAIPYTELHPRMIHEYRDYYNRNATGFDFRRGNDINKNVNSTGYMIQRRSQNLTNNLGRFLVCLKKLLTLLSFCFDGVILIQKLFEKTLLVKFADQSILNYVFGVIDKEVHNSFGDLICCGFADDVEV